ncbi:MAG: aminotransferase class I/II-fold pyridoxal phosphate-dependent enzyme, partial [Methyloceanibacter sp.]
MLRGDWLTSGPSLERFESALADATGAKHAIACTNGTAALHLAMLALSIGPGEAVIVPTVTFLATANAVRFAGAEVVFADVDADTGLLTADLLTEALSRVPAGLRPRAVIPVHLRGLPC